MVVAIHCPQLRNSYIVTALKTGPYICTRPFDSFCWTYGLRGRYRNLRMYMLCMVYMWPQHMSIWRPHILKYVHSIHCSIMTTARLPGACFSILAPLHTVWTNNNFTQNQQHKQARTYSTRVYGTVHVCMVHVHVCMVQYTHVYGTVHMCMVHVHVHAYMIRQHTYS